MGRTNEFTLVATTDMSDKLGIAVKIGTTMVNKTPTGVVATAAKEIDGIITDITAGNPQLLAVGKVGDIVFGKVGTGGVTVGDELEVGTDGVLVTKSTGVVVAKALATGVVNDLIPVIIK